MGTGERMISEACRQRTTILVLTLVALSGAPVLAADTGTVQPKVTWPGGELNRCRFGVLGEASTQPLDSLLQLAAGPARIIVHCGEDPTLTPPPVTVNVRAGGNHEAKFTVDAARVRVMSKKDGVMLAGEARFYEVGRALLDPPLAVLPTNSTAHVAAGQYDLRVRLTGGKGPVPEVLQSKLRLKPGRNPDVELDLADGILVGLATENGKRAEGAVRASRNDVQVALGDTLQPLTLPAGLYEVVVELRSAANFTSASEAVWVQPNKTVKSQQAFKTGKLQVQVTQDNKPIEATVRLSLPLAAEFFNFFDAPGPCVLTPGRYMVNIESKAAKGLGELKKTEVVIKAKQTSKLSFDLSQATLRATITKNGQPIKGIVEVREPGGGKVIARMASTEVRLWPGRYELVARLPDGSENVDGPFEVKLGEKVQRTVAFHRSQLTVQALRGPAPEPKAKVLIFRPGAAKPIKEGVHGEAFELMDGTYDLKVVAGADTVWSQGVEVKGDAKVQVSLPELADAEALPEGEAPADDFELPEGDADP